MKTENQNLEKTGSRTNPETRDPKTTTRETSPERQKEYDTLKPDVTQTPKQNNGINDPKTAPKTAPGYKNETDTAAMDEDNGNVVNQQQNRDPKTNQQQDQTRKPQQPTQQQPNQRNQPQTDPRKKQEQSATKRNDEPKR